MRKYEMLKIFSLVLMASFVFAAWLPIGQRTLGNEAITVIDSYWGSPRNPVKAYPGTQSNTLTVVLRNELSSNITGATGTLGLPEGFSSVYGEPRATSSWSGTARPGDTFTLAYQIDVAEDITPGKYEANLTIQYVLYDGSRGLQNGLKVALYIDPVPSIKLAIVNSFWGEPGESELALPGSRDLSFTIQVLNLDNYDLTGVVATLRLPTGLFGRYSENALNDILGTIPIGGYGTAIFRGIYVSSAVAERYRAQDSILTPSGMISIEYTFNLEGKLVRSKYGEVVVRMPIYTHRTGSLALSALSWSYGGDPIAPIAGAENIDLAISLVNLGEYAISASSIRIEAPSGFKVKALRPGNLQPIAPGGSASITATFDLSDGLQPGSYRLTLRLEYILETGGSGSISTESLSIPIEIYDASSIDTSIELISVYWGSPNNPMDAIPGVQDAPLTLELVNRGMRTAYGLTIEYDLPSGMMPSQSPRTSVSMTMNPGSIATATIEVDIDPKAKPGFYNISFKLEYSVIYAGASLRRLKVFSSNVKLDQPPIGYGYLELASVDWGQGKPVYPGDENVTLTLTFVNRAPYTISGLLLRMKFPEGFAAKGGASKIYAPGAIARSASRNVDMTISIDKSAHPGTYTLEASCDYLLESGGYGIRLNESYAFNVTLNTLEGSLEFVQSLWYGTSAGPGDTGIQLVILLRNLEIPSMMGVVGDVELPEGFIVSTTGEAKGRFASVSLAGALPSQFFTSGIIPPTIPFEVQPRAAFNLGDYLYFVVPVTIDPSAIPGIHAFNLRVSFLDQWNTPQSVVINCSLYLLGSIKLIDVEPIATDVPVGGCGNFSVRIVNRGSSPAYDVYFIFLNMPPGVSLEKQVFYIPRIEAGNSIIAETQAYGNPNAPYKGALTAVAMISFKDCYGYSRRYNATFLVNVKGRIEFKLLDLTVVPSPAYKGARITISGLLLNIGRETAKHVSVYLKECEELRLKQESSQYLGNVDPDAQMPFILEAEVMTDIGSYTLFIGADYMDEYGGSYHQTYAAKIEVGELPKPPQPSLEELLYRIAPIAIASAFLVIMGYLILRYVRRMKLRS
ncbi:MAG: NEW3 domain-containing protein [Candidatus Bathyarchaeia archaeon]